MSRNRAGSGNAQPSGMKPQAFNKSDFVIKNKQDNSFAQIDSFKVTAKKAAEQTAVDAQPGHIPQHHMMGISSNEMYNYQSNMNQGALFHPMMQPMNFNPMVPRGGAPVNQVMIGVPSSYMMQGASGNQMMQGAPASQMMQGVHANQMMQGAPASQMMQGAPASQMMQGTPGKHSMPGTSVNQIIPGTYVNQMMSGASSSQMIQDMPFNQIVPGAHAGQVPPAPVSTHPQVSTAHMMQSSVNSWPYGVPQEDGMSGSSIDGVNNTTGHLCNEQSTQSQSRVAGASWTNLQFSEDASSSVVDDGFGDFSQISSSQTFQTGDPTVTDEFQDFSEFSKPNAKSSTNVPLATSANITEFASFSSNSLSTKTDNFGKHSTSETDDFGDFSTFSEAPNNIVQAPVDQSKRLPQSLDGKRMNIVVKNNLGAKAVQLNSQFKSTRTPPSSSAANMINKPRKSLGPGLGNLAESLAAATCQLTQPRPTPMEEQKDFTVLQEVVSNINMADLPPIVKEPDASFTLPDTPTQLNEIFPKCAPKKSLHSDEDDSFQEFADFSKPKEIAQSSFSLTANMSSATAPIDQTVSNDEEFGGFADFSKAPVDENLLETDLGTLASSVDTPVSVGIDPAKLSNPDELVKSHAVDWSAFTALDELRAEEEEGVLGDFSVFGNSLKAVATEETAKEQPNFLLSPEHKVENHQPQLFELTNPEKGVAAPDFNLANQNKDEFSPEQNLEEEWADFAEPVVTTEADAADNGWAAFSEPLPVSSAFDTQVPTTNESLNGKELPYYLKVEAETCSIGSADGPLAAVKHAADLLNDNDSDFSGHVFPRDFHADNVSSDWSFKDNTSMQLPSEDAKSNSSAAEFSKPTAAGSPTVDLFTNDSPTVDLFTNDLPTVDLFTNDSPTVDWTTETKPATNWTMNSEASVDWTTVGPTSTVDWSASSVPFDSAMQTPGSSTNAQANMEDEDDWEAFGAINRSKQVIEMQHSPPIEKANTATDSEEIPEFSAFNSSPPPFSPPASDLGLNTESNWGFSTDLPTLAQPAMKGTEPEANDEWSAFGEVEVNAGAVGATIDTLEQCPPSTSDVAEDKQVLSAVRPNILNQDSDRFDFSPPPMDDDDNWGGFDDAQIADDPVDTLKDEWTDSPIAFSPPPLTDHDFSPLKSLPRNDSDWFSFPDASEKGLDDDRSESPAQEGGLSTGLTALSLEDAASDDQEAIVIEITNDTISDESQFPIEQANPSQPVLRDQEAIVIEITNDTISDESQFPIEQANPSQPVPTDIYRSSTTEANNLDIEQPPPLPELTPGDEEMPTFAGGPPELTVESEEEFDGFHSMSAGYTDSSVYKDLSADAEVLEVPESDWGFSKEDDSGDKVTAEADWSVETGSGEVVGKEEEVDDDWAFQAFTDTQETHDNKVKDLPAHTDADTSAVDDDNWGFSSPGVDGEDWTSNSQPANQKPDVVTVPDDEFGDFPDDDDFQGFDESSSVPIEPPPGSSTMVTPEKAATLLNSIFQCSLSQTSSTSSQLTDSIKSNSLWSSLTDLNQSVSLQLQWKESGSHANLLSSLRITDNQSASTFQGLQPVPAHSSSEIHTVGQMMSSILSPVKQANGTGLDIKKPYTSSGTTELTNSLDMDFLSDMCSAGTNNNVVTLPELTNPATTTDTVNGADLINDFL